MEFCQDCEANNLYSKQSVVFNGQDSECHSFGGFFPLAWGRRAISGIYRITPNHASSALLQPFFKSPHLRFSISISLLRNAEHSWHKHMKHNPWHFPFLDWWPDQYRLYQYKSVLVTLKLPLIYMGTTEIRTQTKNLNRSFIFLNQEQQR